MADDMNYERRFSLSRCRLQTTAYKAPGMRLPLITLTLSVSYSQTVLHYDRVVKKIRKKKSSPHGTRIPQHIKAKFSIIDHVVTRSRSSGSHLHTLVKLSVTVIFQHFHVSQARENLISHAMGTRKLCVPIDTLWHQDLRRNLKKKNSKRLVIAIGISMQLRTPWLRITRFLRTTALNSYLDEMRDVRAKKYR